MVLENSAGKDTLHTEATAFLTILFIVNPGAGNHTIDWPKEIEAYFRFLNHSIEIYFLKPGFSVQSIQEKIVSINPDIVVAVGGDGTVSLVTECLLQKNIPLAILPAGSANGLAKELGISEIPAKALAVICTGTKEKVHAIMVNSRACIHLSDIGFNARMIKNFQSGKIRGIWGYAKATIKLLWSSLFINPMMQVCMTLDNKVIEIEAAMIVIANSTKYGSGAVINPLGSLKDELFEIIIIKKISILEIFKMMVSHASFNPAKTVVFSTKQLTMRSARKVHFQIDGEYLGKVNEIKADLMPAAIELIVPVGKVIK